MARDDLTSSGLLPAKPTFAADSGGDVANFARQEQTRQISCEPNYPTGRCKPVFCSDRLTVAARKKCLERRKSRFERPYVGAASKESGIAWPPGASHDSGGFASAGRKGRRCFVKKGRSRLAIHWLYKLQVAFSQPGRLEVLCSCTA